ncbi:MAG: dihydropteroate synthase [bacterium]
MDADPEAPCIVWFGREREALQVATSAVGLGIDLTETDESRVVASLGALKRLLPLLEELAPDSAAALRRFLEPVPVWRLRTRSIPLDQAIVMGILNLTDDSFSGDGVGRDLSNALARASALREAGATIIDVGAESARADRPVLEGEEEALLVGRCVSALAGEGHVVSSDTYKPTVARAALESGAEIINDISGLTLGLGAAEEARKAGAAYVLNYSYSVPKRRPDHPPRYEDVVIETVRWMEQRLSELAVSGLQTNSIAIDPGIAFGKSHEEDIQILRRIGELRTFGQPILLAHSRKNFIGSINGQPPADRDIESHVASSLAFAQGVRIFRVHDPAGARRALEIAAAVTSNHHGEFSPDETSWPWRAGANAAHMTKSEPDKAAPAGQRW